MTTSLQNTRGGGIPDPDGTPLLVGAGYSPGPRTRPGERLHHVFEERVDWMRSSAEPTHLAVDAGEVTLTFAELDERANQAGPLPAGAGCAGRGPDRRCCSTRPCTPTSGCSPC